MVFKGGWVKVFLIFWRSNNKEFFVGWRVNKELFGRYYIFFNFVRVGIGFNRNSIKIMIELGKFIGF